MRPLLCFFLKYDYGIPERGDSLEKLYFWPAIKKHSPESEVFWLEEIGFLENNKDIEIGKLNEELDVFKKTIEESKSTYESMLDKTTRSLEKIISNTETLSKIQ